MKVTVVSAFYEIPSKFPSSQYWKWIQNFCEIPFDLVLFTSPNLVEKFKVLRKDRKNTKIIALDFKKLEHYKFYNIYQKHHEIDYYKKIHSPELYILWAEKLKFVMRAIEKNYFDTDVYIWCDIGIFRETQFLETFKTFPKYESIVKDKMNFLMLQPFSQQNLVKDKFGLVGQRYGEIRLGGGIHGGGVDAWKEYEKLWDSTLQRYFQAGRFAGQDQCVMGTIFLENSHLFNIITPKDYGGDPWFYLLYHWSI